MARNNLSIPCVDFTSCENAGWRCYHCTDYMSAEKEASLFAEMMEEYDEKERRLKETREEEEWDF